MLLLMSLLLLTSLLLLMFAERVIIHVFLQGLANSGLRQARNWPGPGKSSSGVIFHDVVTLESLLAKSSKRI
jgi:hypothetical protein